MPNDWDAFTNHPNKTCGYELEKGGALFYNFHLARAAGESLIISPVHDGVIAEMTFTDVLGDYPQPPFSLHVLDGSNNEDMFESIRQIMCETDGLEYARWQPMELEPFYQIKDGTGTP